MILFIRSGQSQGQLYIHSPLPLINPRAARVPSGNPSDHLASPKKNPVYLSFFTRINPISASWMESCAAPSNSILISGHKSMSSKRTTVAPIWKPQVNMDYPTIYKENRFDKFIYKSNTDFELILYSSILLANYTQLSVIMLKKK